jgi:3-methyladenine DNA glycosylase AlkC
VIPRHADDASTTSWALADRYRAVARGEIAAAPASVAEAMANAIAARARPALERMGFVAPALS